MGDSRPVIDLTKKASAPSEDEVKSFKAQVAKMVSRGVVMDRLTIDLPNDVHGEWIRDDAVSIAEAKAVGFAPDDKYGIDSSLHTDATGKITKVGDAVFMTMPKWKKEVIDQVKKQEMERHHGIRNGKQVGKPSEESQYESNLKAGMPDIPVINESKTEVKSLNALVN